MKRNKTEADWDRNDRNETKVFNTWGGKQAQSKKWTIFINIIYILLDHSTLIHEETAGKRCDSEASSEWDVVFACSCSTSMKLQHWSKTVLPAPKRSAGPDPSGNFLVEGQWRFLNAAQLDLVVHSLLNIHMERWTYSKTTVQHNIDEYMCLDCLCVCVTFLNSWDCWYKCNYTVLLSLLVVAVVG